MARAILLSAVCLISSLGCRHPVEPIQTPDNAELEVPLPAYSPLSFRTTAEGCPGLEVAIVAAQWPEPQWVRADRALVGGGWSSISTGRFGSASWEHCENLGTVSGNTFELLETDYPWGGLRLGGDACRVPDGVLGSGELYDLDSFREIIASRSPADARKKVGWRHVWQWEDYFYFDELRTYSTLDRKWSSAGWPKEGMHRGWSAAPLPNGDLLVAGGYTESDNGAETPVAQAARYDHAAREWFYVEPGPAVTEPVMVRWRTRVWAVGDGIASAFNPTTNTWEETSNPPALPKPLVAAAGDDLLVAGEDQRVVLWSPEQGARERAMLPERPHALLAGAGGIFAVDAIDVRRFVDGAWVGCSVDRQLDEHPPSGRGLGALGPAMFVDGTLWLTRIDRERYYDYE